MSWQMAKATLGKIATVQIVIKYMEKPGLNNFTATMCPSSPPHPKTIYAQSTVFDTEHVFKACIWTLDSILCLYVIV